MPRVISQISAVISQTDGATTKAITAEIDLAGMTLRAIGMPSSWTAANLTFKAAAEKGGTYQNVYDDAGAEITVTAAASEMLTLLTVLKQLTAYRFIKIRSGTSGTPVAQEANRTLTLFLEDTP